MRLFQVFSRYALEEVLDRALEASAAAMFAGDRTRDAEDALEDARIESTDRAVQYTEAAEDARKMTDAAESADVIGWLAILEREQCSRLWRFSEARQNIAYQALELTKREERAARSLARKLEEKLEAIRLLEQAAERLEAAELPLSREASRRPNFNASPLGDYLRGSTHGARRFHKRQATRFNRRRNRAEVLSYLGWGEQ